MTIPTAIELLDSLKTGSRPQMHEALSMATFTLADVQEYWTPKMVRNETRVGAMVTCPQCGAVLDVAPYPYCHWCGQLLDWSEVMDE